MHLSKAVLVPQPHNHHPQLHRRPQSYGDFRSHISWYLQTLTAGFLKKLLKMQQVFFTLPASDMVSVLSGFRRSEPVCLQSPVSLRQ